MRDTINELWLPTHIAVSFQYDILCLFTLHSWLQLGCMWTFYKYQTTALLLEMSIFWVRVACQIPLASYVSKHTPQSLSDKPFMLSYVAAYRTAALLHSLCGLQLHERSDWRATAPVLWYNVVARVQVTSGSRYRTLTDIALEQKQIWLDRNISLA